MSIKNLKQFVEQENYVRSLFDRRNPLGLATHDERVMVAQLLDSKLSGENLTCDGELRGAALAKKARYLQKCVQELEELDPQAGAAINAWFKEM